MRRITIDEIRSKVSAKGQMIDHSVNLFRGKTERQGWIMKRTRPRDSDEIKALNYLSRRKLRNALKEETIIYDKERRVLSFGEYSGS